MEASELRIGNLLQRLDATIFEVTSTDISIIDSENPFSVKLKPKPIPLTEEWLIKFGFEKLTDTKDGFKSTSYTYTKGISFIVHFDGTRLSTNFWIGNEKHYVHQLQNLFFALTGKELKSI